MKILFTFDEEIIDPIDPMGNIILTDGKNTIEEKNTYLDSWFLALKDGWEFIKKSESTKIDIYEEPVPLMFSKIDSKIKIKYKNHSIFVNDEKEFIDGLKTSLNLFLNSLMENSKYNKNETLKILEVFLNNIQ